MKNRTFFDLFFDQLCDMYSGEKQIVTALPKMIKAAQSEELKEAVKTHLTETKAQIERLEEIFHMLNLQPKNEMCEAMKGILEEADEVIKNYTESPVKDAALIACAQRVEHYEIAVYGTLRTFAQHFKLNEIADLLQETLNEEGTANKTLTSIAEGGYFSKGINTEAEHMMMEPAGHHPKKRR